MANNDLLSNLMIDKIRLYGKNKGYLKNHPSSQIQMQNILCDRHVSLAGKASSQIE